LILEACQRRNIIAILGKSVVQEYRRILADPEIVADYPQLEPRKVSTSFEFPRDPKDAKFLELCIAGRATHLLTTDRDFLDLMTATDETARRLHRRMPNLQILPPHEFVVRHSSNLGIE